ncbi:GSCFA domain-containing protein [Confluentibacter flavum]|uniref:GSCFA domain-containing protein n=1 Tax=Confluentibacter flavum TaxID=1909700 RepID=A0A2N3HPR9_9FLAO|nr:GSCFA domain-containing protein [Confluentibacter flavum]PKQ46921.1 GSCFA domain-containing protein [Confluentibacter flavum]
MKLQTQIPLTKQSKNLIDYHSNILLLGSCFVENIGDKLSYFKFQNLQNPFGIIFNPVSLAKIVERSLKQNYYSEKDIFFHNEQWNCFEVHSELSNPNKETFLNSLNELIDSTNKQLIDSTHIIITLGTAWVYRFVETNTTVANCHKVPQKQFVKELLSVDDIINSLETMVSLIHSVNSKASIIFTVSPVRHIKDGFVENTISKSHLISAIHKVIPPLGDRGLYFPSYEIMMDELRDYRFYAEDMLHPNQTAINYIWEKFQLVWISTEVFKTMNCIDTIQKGLRHKPFHQNSEAHQEFLKKLEAHKLEVQKKYAHITF